MYMTIITWVLGRIFGKDRGQALAPKATTILKVIAVAGVLAFATYKGYQIGYGRAARTYQASIDKCYGDWEQERQAWNDRIEDIGKTSERETATAKAELSDKQKSLDAAIEAYKKAAEEAGVKPAQPAPKESVNTYVCTGGLSHGAVRALRGAMP